MSGNSTLSSFADQRQSTIAQLKQQELMRANSSASNTSLQRFAYVGAKQIIESYEGMERYPDVMSTTEQVDSPDENQAKLMSDNYHREYKNKQEFIDHTTGKRVDVGLARKLGKWYRLPFFSQNKFFVLGENHGAFGYRELIQESNQPGAVLGEGGSNSLLSATPGNLLQATPKGLKTKDGGARENTMENVAAKSYFGLTLLLSEYKKASGPPATTAAVQRLPEAEWLVNYQKAKPGDRQTGTKLNQIPYYLDEHQKKVYASYGTKAETYDPIKTAFNVVRDLKTAIDAYGDDDDDINKIKPVINSLIEKNNEIPRDYAVLIGIVEQLFPLVQPLAYRETKKMSKRDISDVLEQRQATVESNQKYKSHASISFSLRDEAMYRSVLKARRNHIMAGMGDNHATNLKTDLTSAGVPVVLFSEFTSQYSLNAIAPAGEKAQGRTLLSDDSESGD
jgi:hypothetical protein